MPNNSLAVIIERHDLAKSTPNPTQRRSAWDLKLWKQIGIIGGDNLGLDSMVITAAFTVRHRARPATLDRPAWVTSRWKKSQLLRDVQLHRSGSRMSNDAAGMLMSDITRSQGPRGSNRSASNPLVASRIAAKE